MPDFLITNPQTDAGKRAAELFTRWQEQRAAIARLGHDERRARADLQEAEQALVDTARDAALGGRSQEAALLKKRGAARARINEPWASRIAGVTRAAETIRGKFVRHVGESLAELLSEPEFQDRAIAARERLIDALAALREAHGHWHAVAQDVAQLLAWAEGPIDASVLPALGALDALMAEVDRIEVLDPVQAIPAPLPSELALVQYQEILDHGVATTGVPMIPVS
jgi:hypothetical protein